ncbi:MAG: hypothetical protein II642_05715, partial [Firmicutes bacterium]|nr:hypothetical protein [Bacillota bacterium]
MGGQNADGSPVSGWRIMRSVSEGSIIPIRGSLRFVTLNLYLKSNLVENKVYNLFKTTLSKNLD